MRVLIGKLFYLKELILRHVCKFLPSIAGRPPDLDVRDLCGLPESDVLLERRRNKGVAARPSLLVAPASLLANWSAEIEKFAPELRTLIIHPSAMTTAQVKNFTPAQTAGLDLAITSYGSLLRIPALADIHWHFAILDEAQAIKNPGAKQTRAA